MTTIKERKCIKCNENKPSDFSTWTLYCDECRKEICESQEDNFIVNNKEVNSSKEGCPDSHFHNSKAGDTRLKWCDKHTPNNDEINEHNLEEHYPIPKESKEVNGIYTGEITGSYGVSVGGEPIELEEFLKNISCPNNHCGDECCWDGYDDKLIEKIKDFISSQIKQAEERGYERGVKEEREILSSKLSIKNDISSDKVINLINQNNE